MFTELFVFLCRESKPAEDEAGQHYRAQGWQNAPDTADIELAETEGATLKVGEDDR